MWFINFLSGLFANILSDIISGHGTRRPWQRLRRFIAARDMPAAPGTHFTVLVADLDGDVDLTQSRHVTDALRSHRGLHVRRYGRSLVVDDHGDLAEAEASAEHRGRSWLEAQNAEVLIWGRVKVPNRVLEIRFLAASPTIFSETEVFILNDRIELPTNFNETFSSLIYSAALASIGIVTERDRHYLLNLLQPIAAKIYRLHEHPLPSFTNWQRFDVANAYGIVAFTLGSQSDDQVWLEKAISAFENALSIIPDHASDDAPDRRAAALNNLGAALEVLGSHKEQADLFERAAATYRAALQVQTQERAPLRRAEIESNLGNVLRLLGAHRGDVAHLEKAIAAYQAVIKVWTPERMPKGWARVQSGLGAIYEILGRRMNDVNKLRDAERLINTSLQVLTQQRVPFDWASSQYNLGHVLDALGQFTNEIKYFDDAAAAYRAALTVYTIDRLPMRWASVQNDLANTLNSRGERTKSICDLREAVATYRRALEIRTRERVPLKWARTQMNLGVALKVMETLDNNAEHLEEAVVAFTEAQGVLSRELTPFLRADVCTNLGNTLARLGERRNEIEYLRQAVTAQRAALEVWTLERAPVRYATVQNNLGTVFGRLAVVENNQEYEHEALAAYRAAHEALVGCGGHSYLVDAVYQNVQRAEVIIKGKGHQS